MCGIIGLIDYTNKLSNINNILLNMTDSLLHRGPDFGDIYLDENFKVGLGHRRLSIQDISSAGNQPMISSDNNLIIVFNGEIYNHLKIRETLESEYKIEWAGNSDTETLLIGVEKWGLYKMIEKCEGMFSFALYDKLQKKIFLARDRAGEKPLYYGFNNNLFLFASELKAFKVIPNFKKEIDYEALKFYFQFSYIPSPKSIFKGIYKLIPGNILEIDLKNRSCPKLSKHQYWNYDTVKREKININNLKFDLKKLLINKIEDQLISDIPVGTFLSGGIDSSLITCIANEITGNKIDSFTVAMNDKKSDESEHAKKIANHLNIRNETLFIPQNFVKEIFYDLSEIFDEPFADSSQIPTLLLSRITKNKVSVILSGDGGDELFGGYNRYFSSENVWNKYSRFPSKLINFLPSKKNNYSSYFLEKTSIKINRLKQMAKLNSKDFKSFYINIIMSNFSSFNVLNENHFNSYLEFNLDHSPTINKYSQQMMDIDFKNYLPDDILTKVDRASMAYSLETRSPFLNHKIIEFSKSIPINQKNNKLILKNILKDYIPPSLFDRPKQGFGLPLRHYLTFILKKEIDDLIDSISSDLKSIINQDKIKHMWRSYLNGSDIHTTGVWNVIIFILWWNKNME